MSKPSLVKGTRDFGPSVMVKRNFIFYTIKHTFQKFGFQPLETPTLETLNVLMGKYGDEGDQLLFKVLNSGDFLKEVTPEDFDEGAKKLTHKISEKGLRYDLTVPFARYVVMNRNELAIPFKRYQIQPVWRADRPQRGRYREFYQCDADVVGTDSLICEAEIVLMLHEIFQNLGITEFTVKINNRKILSGIAETIGMKGSEVPLTVAIDKLDKIGKEKVEDELRERGFSAEVIAQLQPIFNLQGDTAEVLSGLKAWLKNSETGLKGVEEIEKVWNLIDAFGLQSPKIQLDITLARGLSYYTGAIFEVKANNVQMGSISGGGRYDNLTGTFGLPGLSGVGISLGVDRIYDVMEELGLFADNQGVTTQVLLTNFDAEAETYSLPLLKKLRDAGINAEIYPDHAKLRKQFEYADRKKIPYVCVVGSEEMATGELTLKNMQSGEQTRLTIESIIQNLK
ncbi:histidine--tRNA ligase [Emticicia agri]|uniref:Histidine--tRNA ligase n=1 Tax=Emticicia agri TaxID=2492393 RepID=A0A4Q5LYN3_9BACT|nr:histidine--tRNA ligase [Emticicia agri]RYU94924.1 histidine--tRNA ligase [Emticicia agri]